MYAPDTTETAQLSLPASKPFMVTLKQIVIGGDLYFSAIFTVD